MNAKTFKRSGRTDTLSFTVNAFYQIKMTLVELHITLLTINSTNKCTAEDHVVSPDVTRVTTSNTTVFFPPGNWKKRECQKLLKDFCLSDRQY